MGLLPSSIKLLLKYNKKYQFEGPVLSLGNQEIWASYSDLQVYFNETGNTYVTTKAFVPHTSYMFLNDPIMAEFAKDFVHARFFFEMMGINDYADMDKFESDKPTYLHDLNLPVPNDVYDSYSFILDGGTIEHIFDVRQVLSNIVKMLKPGGCVMHISSYSIDHGFYGLSPCLFYDFYKANGFVDFTCHILQVDFRNILRTYRNKNDYFEYKYGMDFQNMLDSSRQAMVFFVGRKVNATTDLNIPVQGIYGSRMPLNIMAEKKNSIQNQYRSKVKMSFRIKFLPGLSFLKKIGKKFLYNRTTIKKYKI
jgi:hypothetical protein